MNIEIILLAITCILIIITLYPLYQSRYLFSFLSKVYRHTPDGILVKIKYGEKEHPEYKRVVYYWNPKAAKGDDKSVSIQITKIKRPLYKYIIENTHKGASKFENIWITENLMRIGTFSFVVIEIDALRMKEVLWKYYIHGVPVNKSQ